jgi:competence protein ComEC
VTRCRNIECGEQPSPYVESDLSCRRVPARMKSPLVIIASVFSAGIVIAHHLQLQTPVGALVLIGVCLLAGAIAFHFGWDRVALAALLSGFVLAGFATQWLYNARRPPWHIAYVEERGIDLADPVRLEGTIASTPQRTPYGVQFDLEATRIESRRLTFPVSGKIRLRIQTPEVPELLAALESLHLQSGDSIKTLANLRRPHIYQNPGSFDFREWLDDIEDIYWVGTVRSPLLMEKLAGRSPPQPWTALARVRVRLAKAIDQMFLPWSAQVRYGAVLKAVLLGDRSALDSETIESFRRTGLYHLLVIAGLHVGLLAFLFGGLLRTLRVRFPWSPLLTLLFLAAYTLLVEQRAPTLRASLMLGLFLIGRLLYREHSILNAVGFAALILLLARPAWLFESGFELSFAAALLIAGLAVPLLERTTLLYRKSLRSLREVRLDDHLAPAQAQFRIDLRALAAVFEKRSRLCAAHPRLAESMVVWPVRIALDTTSAVVFCAILQLGLMLPMAETFHRITLAGIALNTLAIPLMTITLAVAVPSVLISALAPALAPLLGKIVGFVMQGIFILTGMPRIPGWLSFRVPEPPSWVSWGLVLALVWIGLMLKHRPRLTWMPTMLAVVFGALVALHPFPPRLQSDVLELTALDCGSGDALFVVFPDRSTMLVDGGGSLNQSTASGAFQGRRWDPGEDIVSPFLWRLGIKRIDTVVLTHAHEDHMGGLFAVFRNFQVGEFWYGIRVESHDFIALLDLAHERRIPVRQVFAGETFSRGEAKLQILWPQRTGTSASRPSNDESVVMRIEAREGSILLTGDISSKVEEALVNGQVHLRSTVLKVAHHGARTSTSPDFLSSVAPQAAFISTQGGAFMNLPNPDTLARLNSSGARVFQTDLQGALSVRFTRNGGEVTTYGSGAETRAESGISAVSAGPGIFRLR